MIYDPIFDKYQLLSVLYQFSVIYNLCTIIDDSLNAYP